MEAGTDADALEDAGYWLVPMALLSLISYRTQIHQPRGDLTHHGPGPTPSITKGMPYMLTYSRIYGSIFLIEFFPPKRLSLYQVDIKLANKVGYTLSLFPTNRNVSKLIQI
ncbi:hypothetical protein ACRRTK_003694 [Alexandromys fortis]